jgi:hypothetical protein
MGGGRWSFAQYLSKSGVAVEKLFLAKFAKVKLRQRLIGDLLGSQDIFYPSNFDHL